MRLFLLLMVLLPSLLCAASPMKFVYYDNYHPRSWSDNGKMRGILIDIIDEAIGKRLGIPVVHEGYPWKRAQLMVKNGEADAFITMPTDERRLYSDVSEQPALVFQLQLVTRKDHPKRNELERIVSVDELKGYVLVDYLGNGWAKRSLKGVEVEWMPDVDGIYSFLAAERADAVVASKRTIFDMYRLGYNSQLVVLPNVLSSVSFHLCIGKESPHKNILKDFDAIIAEMKNDGTLQRIEENYYK